MQTNGAIWSICGLNSQTVEFMSTRSTVILLPGSLSSLYTSLTGLLYTWKVHCVHQKVWCWCLGASYNQLGISWAKSTCKWLHTPFQHISEDQQINQKWSDTIFNPACPPATRVVGRTWHNYTMGNFIRCDLESPTTNFGEYLVAIPKRQQIVALVVIVSLSPQRDPDFAVLLHITRVHRKFSVTYKRSHSFSGQSNFPRQHLLVDPLECVEPLQSAPEMAPLRPTSRSNRMQFVDQNLSSVIILFNLICIIWVFHRDQNKVVTSRKRAECNRHFSQIWPLKISNSVNDSTISQRLQACCHTFPTLSIYLPSSLVGSITNLPKRG